MSRNRNSIIRLRAATRAAWETRLDALMRNLLAGQWERALSDRAPDADACEAEYYHAMYFVNRLIYLAGLEQTETYELGGKTARRVAAKSLATIADNFDATALETAIESHDFNAVDALWRELESRELTMSQALRANAPKVRDWNLSVSRTMGDTTAREIREIGRAHV